MVLCTMDDHLHVFDTIRCGVCKLDLQTVIQLILHKAEHAGPSAGIACELCGTGFTRRKTLLDHYRHRHGVIANSGHSKKKDHKKNKLPKKLLDDPPERISTRSVGRKRKQEIYTGSEGNGHDINTCKKKKEIRLEQNACQSEVTIPSSSNGEAKKYACPKEDSCSVSNGAVCIGEEGAIGDSEDATDVGSGGTTRIIGGCDIAVRADATGVGSEDTISVSHGAISTKENKNFCKKNISQANPNDTEGHTEALYEQNSSIISHSKVSDVQGDSQRSDHQGNSQGSDHQGDSQRSDHQGNSQGSEHQGDSQGSDHQGDLQGSDHQGNSQGSDHQGDSQGSEHQRNSKGSDHQGDSQRSDHQGDSQNSDSAEKVENISDSEEVCKSNNENIPETSILNSFSESPLQASSNLYDPYIDVITKKVKGTSFEYAKDVYECKECRFSCQCSLEIKKHIHSSHPNLKIQQSVEEQDVTASSQSVVTNQEKSPQIRRKVESQDIIGHYVCNKCKKVFSRLRYLRKHLQTHRTEQNYLCDECGKHFKTKTYLTAHRKIHKKKAFTCQQCDFTSENAFEIHMHRQIHNNGCIICDVCGYAYSDKSTLVKHKRVHDMSRPFACSYPGCTWRFKTESTCIAHLRGHSTVEGKFKCSKCGYAFRHKHHLKRHESKIHGLHPGKIAAPNDMSNEVIASSDSISKNQDVDVNDTVRLLLNTADGATDIGHALQPGNIVITTDTDGNPVNYHVTDIEISSGCETVLEQDKNVTVALCVQTPQEDPDQSHYVPLNISLTEELLTDIGTTENINTEIHTEIPETRTQSADVNQ